MGKETHLYVFFDRKVENRCFNHYVIIIMHSNACVDVCPHYRGMYTLQRHSLITVLCFCYGSVCPESDYRHLELCRLGTTDTHTSTHYILYHQQLLL